MFFNAYYLLQQSVHSFIHFVTATEFNTAGFDITYPPLFLKGLTPISALPAYLMHASNGGAIELMA